MTTLEQAARQALETLERASDAGYSVECDETITALREALEQDAPKAEPGPVSDTRHSQFLSDVLTAAGLITHGKQCKALGARLSDMVMRLRAAPQQEAQEPCPSCRNSDIYACTCPFPTSHNTAPQPAPLSDDVVMDAARYRWLREGNDAKHGAAWHVAVNLYGCEWDAAIDAALAAQGGK